jgi:hypothetical protein
LNRGKTALVFERGRHRTKDQLKSLQAENWHDTDMVVGSTVPMIQSSSKAASLCIQNLRQQ